MSQPRQVSPYEMMGNHERSKERARFAGYKDRKNGRPCSPPSYVKAGSAFDVWYRDGHSY